MPVVALDAVAGDRDAIDRHWLAARLTLARGDDGREHVVISDGRRHVRLDVERGSLLGHGNVVLHYRLHGVASARSRILPLRRLLHFCRHGRFPAALFPPEAGIARGVVLLRVRDALDARASHREIAEALFGASRVAREWHHVSDALRSRVRRLVADARHMSRGGYRQLLRRRGDRDVP